MPVILRRMLGIGKLPDELRAQVDSEGVIFLAEFVPVTRRFSGRVPGHRASGSITSYVGALALTSQRVLATLSTVPRRAGRTIDQRWDAQQTGTMKVEIASAGVKLELDLDRVDPSFSGRLSFNYKTTIPDDVLTLLPTRSLAFDVPPEYVLRAVGVPAPPRAN
jgi:hypothetical protein